MPNPIEPKIKPTLQRTKADRNLKETYRANIFVNPNKEFPSKAKIMENVRKLRDFLFGIAALNKKPDASNERVRSHPAGGDFFEGHAVYSSDIEKKEESTIEIKNTETTQVHFPSSHELYTVQKDLDDKWDNQKLNKLVKAVEKIDQYIKNHSWDKNLSAYSEKNKEYNQIKLFVSSVPKSKSEEKVEVTSPSLKK